MAIAQGRLSTALKYAPFLDPDGTVFIPLIDRERGPIAIEDTSEGLFYQKWVLAWDENTNKVTLTPETTGSPVVVITLPQLLYITFTFDQNGRVTFAYTTETSSFLTWFDTALGMVVTTDLGSDVITPTIHLDDKRAMQNNSSDMLLWYTKLEGGGTYELFMLRQRDRFQSEISMATGIGPGSIRALGMTSGFRVQMKFRYETN